jgi:SAM-dependent methyltransferase
MTESATSPPEDDPDAGAEPTAAALAPGVPADYYERIHHIERTHWWHRGMREITAALLGDRLQSGGRILDAGCGTGGFLRWALDTGSFEATCGIDVATVAVALAGQVAPEAELRVAGLKEIPYPANCFKLVVVNDVLQHVTERELGQSIRELARVLAPDGALLVRTNGGRHARRARADWRVFDRAGLRSALAGANLSCERLTHANMIGSIIAAARGRTAQPPSGHSDGVPSPQTGRRSALAHAQLAAEARYLAGAPSRSLPYGHTLLAVATPR